MADVTIILERTIDRFGEYGGYDPAALYAKPAFYAHITELGDIPTEFEVRLHEHSDGTMVSITPRQLNEMGDLYFPLDALEAAIKAIQQRTEANHRARAEQAGIGDIEGSEAVEAGS